MSHTRDQLHALEHRRRPWFKLARWLALVIAAFIVYENVAAVHMVMHLNEIPTFGEMDQLASKAPGCVELTEVVPGGPMARAGALAHDLFCPADTIDAIRFPRLGETLVGRLQHQGIPRTVSVVAQTPAAGSPLFDATIDRSELAWLLTTLISTLLAALVLWRGNHASALLMGLSLLLFNWWFPHPTAWQNSKAFYAFSLSIYAEGMVLYCLAPIAIFAFGLTFYRESESGANKAFPRLGAWWYRLLYAGAAATAAATLLATKATLDLRPSGIFLLLSAGLKLLYLAASMYLLHRGWRWAEADRRRRYGLLLTGVSLAILAQVVTAVVAIWVGAYWLPENSELLLALGIVGGMGTALIVYAILRHRVLDLSLVVNRAVLYAVLSLAILLAFGMLEYVADQFVHIEGREQNALFDIGIALGLYVGAHYLKSHVEKAIERLFFHAWHRNEEALKRYVKAAETMTGVAAVTTSFVAELFRFTGGAPGALYLQSKTDDDAFDLAVGGLPGVPSSLDGNDRLFATLKAEGEALEPSEVFSTLPAALVLPMRQGSELTGFVLLANKPDGNSYRSDERAILLGGAPHRAGAACLAGRSVGAGTVSGRRIRAGHGGRQPRAERRIREGCRVGLIPDRRPSRRIGMMDSSQGAQMDVGGRRSCC